MTETQTIKKINGKHFLIEKWTDEFGDIDPADRPEPRTCWRVQEVQQDEYTGDWCETGVGDGTQPSRYAAIAWAADHS